MVFNATFNNISVILLWSVLLVEETGVPLKKHQPVQITDKLYHIMLYQYTSPWTWFELTTLVLIGIDCTDSYIQLPYNHGHISLIKGEGIIHQSVSIKSVDLKINRRVSVRCTYWW